MPHDPVKVPSLSFEFCLICSHHTVYAVFFSSTKYDMFKNIDQMCTIKTLNFLKYLHPKKSTKKTEIFKIHTVFSSTIKYDIFKKLLDRQRKSYLDYKYFFFFTFHSLFWLQAPLRNQALCTTDGCWPNQLSRQEKIKTAHHTLVLVQVHTTLFLRE